jgi:hypothetical protein
VNTLLAAPPGCTNAAVGWATWSIDPGVGAETLLGNFAIPANGLVFLEDRRVWVEGQINTARITIAASIFSADPATQSQITVNNNLLYTNFDGQDTISLIAENNFNAGLSSADILTIDAAIVAQQGRAGRYFYPPACGATYARNTITLFGMIATAQRYGFSWTGANNFQCADASWRSSGYCIRNINYDANLLYSPPPSFPLTSDQYSILSWQEIK